LFKKPKCRTIITTVAKKSTIFCFSNGKRSYAINYSRPAPPSVDLRKRSVEIVSLKRKIALICLLSF
jgi:hypothetical protein